MDRMRDVALVLVLRVRAARRQSCARRTVAASAAKRAAAARSVGWERLGHPLPHLGPQRVPWHPQNGERRFSVYHAMARIAERIDEESDATGTARIELI